jgi:two-component system CheB/CheR fusion protein
MKEITTSKEGTLRIVGIGASAGGLEAFEQFFSNMPPDKGIAFVIVQHLDPTGHSSMPQILSRFTKMPVQVTADGMLVEPNSIYLLPPNKSMGIQDGALYLQEPARPPGLRLPIDFFFRSLAKEMGADAICIILSGTGTDGTLGLRAIKAELGTVFVQDPESARYDGMPRSAVDTGLADFVLKPGEIPEKLIQFVEHSVVNGAKFGVTTEEAVEPLKQIFAILRTRTGHDFSRYKQTTIRRRLQRRMSVNQINDVGRYASFLKDNEDEVKALLKDLLISVTNFFRDPEAFEALKRQVKDLVKGKPQGSDMRVWVAGCATGEEAYSVAIIIQECLDELEKHLQVQMYGTDIDIDALHLARTGKYPGNIAADVTPERLRHFFIKENDAYRVKKDIGESIVFAPQNFIKDPPFSKMDLICCRNLLIYLETDVQKRLLPLLHYALKPSGILFLGPSETAGESADLFTLVDRKWKIYQRREAIVPAERLHFPAAFAPIGRPVVGEPLREEGEVKIPELTEKIFLDSYAPTFAVIDEKYRLVYVRGRTGRYLEIASGQPTWTILEMAREGLRTELTSAVYRAISEKRKIVHNGVRIKTNGDIQTVDLTVAPLNEPGLPPGLLMIVFQEVEPTAEGVKVKPSVRSRRRVVELEDELRLTKENLQTTIEELEATNEELKSANEELQSNNEELQSTNEELDTSREELQSLNEELTTLNAEILDKNDLLSKANDDLKNFLNRTDIALIFLDEEFKIRSYTPATSDVFNMREIDIGRPLGDITSRLLYDGIVSDAQEVLRTLRPKEMEVQRKDGCWYKMRILPYLTAQNVVSGLVMSFLDINDQKKAAESLRETRDYLDNLFNHANAPIIVWNPKLEITRFNHAFEQLTGRSENEVLGKKLEILFPEDSRSATMKLIRKTAPEKRWEVVEIPIQHVDGSVRTVLWNSATLFDADGKTSVATIAQGQDITERKRAEEELQEAHDELEIRVKERTAELQQTNERLKEENEERVRTEQSLRLEEARLDALLQLSNMSEASVDETAGFILEHGIALTRSKIGFVGFLSEDESVYTLHAVSKDVVKECAVEGNPLQWHVGEAGIWADAIRDRRTLFVNDYIKPHPNKKRLPPGHPPVSRLMVVPLSEGNKIVAVAGMGNKASDYDESDAQQITLLLQGMWNLTQRKRSQEALKEAYDELEQRVEQRTKELADSNATLQQEITEHKKTEERLRETRDYLENLFNYANAPIIVWDPQYRITRFNHAFEQLTGRTAEEMVGKKVDILIPKDQRKDALEEINGATVKGERWETVEIPIQHVDGSVRVVLWNSATLFDADGKTPVATIAQGQDITDRKGAEHIKDEFIGLVSHELRTPLTVIIGSLTTASDERVSKEEKEELIDEASSSAESLASILDNMLELSRYQAGRLKLNARPVRIADIAGKAVDRVRRKYDTHKIIMDIPEGIPEITVDASRVEQVLYNLLENAVKYSPASSNIRIFSRQEKGGLVLGVSDQGVGIAPEDQPKLFESFARLKGSGAGGTGLGLVVCKHLVEAHGGHIWVESKLGEGSTFLFTIPQGKRRRPKEKTVDQPAPVFK